MIPELLAAAIMLRRVLFDDAFVRAASKPQPDGTPAYARMIRGAAVSIVTGLAPPVTAIVIFPIAIGLPLAAASLLIVTCDWLLSFCGARVRTGLSAAGMSFSRVPLRERGIWQSIAIPFASFLAALVFAWLAFYPPSF